MSEVAYKREIGPNGFEIPSEEEVANLAIEAARYVMAKYPVLAIRFQDAGDLVGEFWIQKRKYLTFPTQAHVEWVRHHVFTYMNLLALNMLKQTRYEPLAWGGIEIDSPLGEGGRDYHEVLEGNFGTPEEFVGRESGIKEMLAAIPDKVSKSRVGIEYSYREIASLLSEGVPNSIIAEMYGISRSRVSAVVNFIKDAITA